MPYPLDHGVWWLNMLFSINIFYMLQKSADTRKKLPPLKPILALPTWGQKCFLSEAEPFEIPDFDLGHPVLYLAECWSDFPLQNLSCLPFYCYLVLPFELMLIKSYFTAYSALTLCPEVSSRIGRKLRFILTMNNLVSLKRHIHTSQRHYCSPLDSYS